MLSLKIFENLGTVMAILEPFELFLSQFCYIFLPLTQSPSPNMMHFFRTSYFCACIICNCLRLIFIEKVGNYKKIVFMKNNDENGW